MRYDNRSTAKTLDAIAMPLARAIEAASNDIRGLSDEGVIDTLFIMGKVCPLDIEDEALSEAEAVIRDKVERRAAELVARDNSKLDIHLNRPDPSYRPNWHIWVMDGHVNALDKSFATFEEAKAAFDALCDFLRLAGREGQFTYETPRPPSSPADDDSEMPF